MAQAIQHAHVKLRHAPGRGSLLLLALAVLLATWWLAMRALEPQPAVPRDAAALQFSATRAEALLQQLVADSKPHPLGTEANQILRDRIVSVAKALGYAPEVQTGLLVCNSSAVCGMPANVVLRIPGRDSDTGGSNDSVLLAAHYDSVGAGPGVSDDAAGVASALEIARILRAGPPPRNSIIILLDDGEEKGLLGATLFAEHSRWAGAVRAVINLEARGTSGTSLMFETSPANAWLMHQYARAVPKPVTSSVWNEIYRHLPNKTDFDVLRSQGAQGYNFAFIGHTEKYHTAADNIRNVDLRSIQQQGDQALSVVRWLANNRIDAAPTGSAEYFDVFGATLVRLPQAIMSPVALGTLVLVLLAIASLAYARQVRLKELAWGLLGIVAAIVSALVGAELVLYATKLACAHGLAAFVPYPWVFLGTFTALAAVVIGGVGAILSRRTGFWALWCVCLLWNSSMACILEGLAPGTGYLCLAPAVLALLVLAVRATGRVTSLRAQAGVSLVQILVTFVVLWPIVIELYTALGTAALPLITLALVSGGLSLLGLLSLSGPGPRRAFITAAALVMTLGFFIGVLLPAYTPSFPQAVNVMYWVDADNGAQQARWLVAPASGRLPAQFKRLGQFAGLSRPLFAWQGDAIQPGIFESTAPVLSIPGPRIDVQHADRISATDPLRLYHVHVSSTLAGAETVLAFPAGSLAPSSTVKALGPAQQGWVTAGHVSDPGKWTLVQFVGLPSMGVDLTFESARADLQVVAMDVSYGLPQPGAPFARARGEDAAPSQDGDVSVKVERIHLRGD